MADFPFASQQLWCVVDNVLRRLLHAAERVGDQYESEYADGHEDDRLHRVGDCCGAQSACQNVGEHNTADD